MNMIEHLWDLQTSPSLHFFVAMETSPGSLQGCFHIWHEYFLPTAPLPHPSESAFTLVMPVSVWRNRTLHANVLLFSPDDPDLGPKGRAPSGQSLAWNIVSTQTLEKKYQCSTATPPVRQLFASAWDIKYKPIVWLFFLLTHQRNPLYDKNMTYLFSRFSFRELTL